MAVSVISRVCAGQAFLQRKRGIIYMKEYYIYRRCYSCNAFERTLLPLSLSV